MIGSIIIPILVQLFSVLKHDDIQSPPSHSNPHGKYDTVRMESILSGAEGREITQQLPDITNHNQVAPVPIPTPQVKKYFLGTYFAREEYSRFREQDLERAKNVVRAEIISKALRKIAAEDTIDIKNYIEDYIDNMKDEVYVLEADSMQGWVKNKVRMELQINDTITITKQ